MIEEKSKKKNKVIKGIALLGLFLMVVGISYALFKVTLNGKKTNKITTAKFDVRLTTTDGIEEKDLPEGVMGVNLEGSNAVPMTQEEGMTLEPYKFVVSNRGSVEASYKLTLEDIEGITNTLQDQYIRYNLVSKDYYDYREYHEGDFANGMYSTEYSYTEHGLYWENGSKRLSETASRVLDETTLMPNECIEYTLNLWIDEEATTEQASEKEFSAKIKVDATQASVFAKGKAGDNIDYTYYKDGTLILTGIGAMNGLEVDNDFNPTNINNNVNPLTDIAYNYLTSQGFELPEENTFYVGMLVNVINNFNDKYLQLTNHFSNNSIDYCYTGVGGSSCDGYIGGYTELFPDKEVFKQVVASLYQIPMLTRVIVDEGITATSYYAFTLSEGMISLPSTLETINFYSIDCAILNIPNSVQNVGVIPSHQLRNGAQIINIDNTEEFVLSHWDASWNEDLAEEDTINYLR